MGQSCCVTKKHDMMAEYDNRKKKSIKADKELIAGVGAGSGPMGPSSTTQDGFGGIDVDGMQQDNGGDSLNMRQSLVDSYMASSQIEPRQSDAIPSAAVEPVKVEQKSTNVGQVADKKQMEPEQKQGLSNGHKQAEVVAEEENREQSDFLEFEARRNSINTKPDTLEIESVSDNSQNTYQIQPTPRDNETISERSRRSSQRSTNRNSVKGFTQLLQEKHLKAEDIENEDAVSQGSNKNQNAGSKANLKQALHVKKVKQIMKLSIAVTDEEDEVEQQQQEQDAQEFEDFRPTDNLEEELMTPKIETDDDFAAQVNAGLETQQYMHTQKAAEAAGANTMEAMMVGEVPGYYNQEDQDDIEAENLGDALGEELGDALGGELGDTLGGEFAGLDLDEMDYKESSSPVYENHSVQMNRQIEIEPEIEVDADYNQLNDSQQNFNESSFNLGGFGKDESMLNQEAGNGESFNLAGLGNDDPDNIIPAQQPYETAQVEWPEAGIEKLEEIQEPMPAAVEQPEEVAAIAEPVAEPLQHPVDLQETAEVEHDQNDVEQVEQTFQEASQPEKEHQQEADKFDIQQQDDQKEEDQQVDEQVQKQEEKVEDQNSESQVKEQEVQEITQVESQTVDKVTDLVNQVVDNEPTQQPVEDIDQNQVPDVQVELQNIDEPTKAEPEIKQPEVIEEPKKKEELQQIEEPESKEPEQKEEPENKEQEKNEPEYKEEPKQMQEPLKHEEPVKQEEEVLNEVPENQNEPDTKEESETKEDQEKKEEPEKIEEPEKKENLDVKIETNEKVELEQKVVENVQQNKEENSLKEDDSKVQEDEQAKQQVEDKKHEVDAKDVIDDNQNQLVDQKEEKADEQELPKSDIKTDEAINEIIGAKVSEPEVKEEKQDEAVQQEASKDADNREKNQDVLKENDEKEQEKENHQTQNGENILDAAVPEKEKNEESEKKQQKVEAHIEHNETNGQAVLEKNNEDDGKVEANTSSQEQKNDDDKDN